MKLLRSKGIIIGLVAVVILAVAGTSVGYAAMSKTVTLSVDGQEQSVTLFGNKVSDVLAAESVEVGDRDRVVPSADESIEEGSLIEVQYARPLELTMDGATDTHWIYATTVATALDELGLDEDGLAVSVSRGATIDREGMALEVVTPRDLTIIVGAEEPVTEPVAALTVADVLDEKGITVDDDDTVTPAPETAVAAGDTITVTFYETKEQSAENQVVAHDTEQVEDDTLAKGETEVQTEGVDGAATITWNITYKNGVEESRTETNRVVTTEPVTEVVKVGTKEEEESSSDSSDSSSDSGASSGGSNYESGDTVWDQLAQCESGGNWAINTGNGYYGGLQFSYSTWKAYGGSGYPHENSRAEQIRIAEKLRSANGGYGAWPGCSSKLGLN